MLDLSTQVRLCDLLHVSENHPRDLLWREAQVALMLIVIAVLDVDVECGAASPARVDLERPLPHLDIVLHLWILHRTSNEPSRVENDVLQADACVSDHAHVVRDVFRSGTDETPLAMFAKLEHNPCRSRSVTLLVDDDLHVTRVTRIRLEFEGDAGGGGSQI
jgi:hypothetical protein